jgi:hypothetical protein
MKSYRKLTYLSAVLLLSVWILPIVAQAIPPGCFCCEMAECCCGCNQKKSSADDGDLLKTSPCKCTISGNGPNETPVYLNTSKFIKNKHALSLSTYLREEQKPVPNENKAFLTNNKTPLKFISLFLLKDSFLL